MIEQKIENDLEQEAKPQDQKKALAKETVREFLKSLLIGWIPVCLDYVFSAIVLYFASLKGLGYGFGTPCSRKQLLGIIPATAVGYFMGLGTYFLMVLCLYTTKGILKEYLSIYLRRYYFWL